MRLHRFYKNELIHNPQVGITTSFGDSEQMRKVFRLKTGDKVIVFDGSGFDFVCEILSYSSETGQDPVSLRIIEIVKNNITSQRETILCAAIVKKDTFEWIAQKATEIGVSRIVPVIAERSEKKNLNMERLHKIVIEAAEQSGRATIPVVEEPALLSDVITQFSDASSSAPSADIVSVVWDMNAKKFSPSDIQAAKKVITYIGPEGGWSPTELDLFATKNLLIISMGQQVLRAETAVVSALTLTTLI
jgi:16S rRNA (uracil1498-N3)-methyltransferase